MTIDREREELKARLRKADVVTPIDLLAAADTIAELEERCESAEASLGEAIVMMDLVKADPFGICKSHFKKYGRAKLEIWDKGNG